MTIYSSERARPELLDPLRVRPGEHLWIAAVAHVLSDATVQQVIAGETDIHMDGENLADVQVGCFICEEQLTKRMYHRRCAGDPSERGRR